MFWESRAARTPRNRRTPAGSGLSPSARPWWRLRRFLAAKPVGEPLPSRLTPGHSVTSPVFLGQPARFSVEDWLQLLPFSCACLAVRACHAFPAVSPGEVPLAVPSDGPHRRAKLATLRANNRRRLALSTRKVAGVTASWQLWMRRRAQTIEPCRVRLRRPGRASDSQGESVNSARSGAVLRGLPDDFIIARWQLGASTRIVPDQPISS
jgi:hypothetical protein